MIAGIQLDPVRRRLLAEAQDDRPEMPEELVPQWEDAPAYFGAFNWSVAHAPALEADDLLGSLAAIETAAGGRALLYTGDRDMFQCVGDDVAVLWPVGAKGEPEVIGPKEVDARYGIGPEQVPDFIALRGDPSDGIPGAKGIGEKTARDLLRDHATLDDLIAAAAKPSTDLRPRIRASLTDGAQALRDYREMATLQQVDIERPPDARMRGRRSVLGFAAAAIRSSSVA